MVLLASRNRELCSFISFPRLHDPPTWTMLMLYDSAASFARAARYMRKGGNREPGVSAVSTCSSTFPVLRACVKSIVIMERFQRTLIRVCHHHPIVRDLGEFKYPLYKRILIIIFVIIWYMKCIIEVVT